ncbi:MAG: hypothetical protein JSS98_01995 [Bacteroidetes bacterium]|nr:hypothetical protein [Bacteroidota bacterium]
MRKIKLFIFLVALVATTTLSAQTIINQCAPINSSQLKTMLSQLGYEVKDAGTSSYTIVSTRDGSTLPILAQLSGNTENIWLTINLGDADSLNTKKNYLYLKESSYSSNFFYVSEGKIIIAQKIDNRGIDNALLRKRIDGLTQEAVASTYLWGKGN